MGLKTDFNQSPYFDDFNEEKNFHRVLFKPAVAVQARELTQLQTILQNQIERFGNNILTEGTIVQGGNFVEESSLPYVKLLDIATNTSGSEVSTDVNQYVGLKAVGLTNGVEAIIIATEYGLESQSPNLSTLFVKYIKSKVDGNGENIKTFAAGEAIQLYTQDSNGNFTIPYHTVTVATATVDTAGTPVGKGYGVRCGNGVIYQKGHFIKFTDGLTIVSKYSNVPDGVVVGFETAEEIVDSNADSSLLDNANGFNNENAPGADRLKLSPGLVVKTIEEASGDDTFFAIQEYANGKVVRRKLSTQYNKIEKEMERRTSEESGDYVVNRFDVSVQTDTANTSNLKVVIDPGIAYVDGMRVQLINAIDLSLPDANTFSTIRSQDINTNYGSYVIVNDLSGKFDAANLEQVQFYRSADLVNPIGAGRIRVITKQSNGYYRLYLTSINMNSSTYTFADTDVIKSTTSTGTANTVKSGGVAVLRDASFTRMFFPTGKSFMKSVIANQTDFVYRTNSSSTINSSTVTLTVSSPDKFPYTLNSSLNSDELLDLIVIANASVGPISQGESIGINSASLDSTGQVLTVQLAKNPGGNLLVHSYYNVKKGQASIGTKALRTVYVKAQANTHSAGVNGPWSLGLPDTYQLLGVWKGTSTTSWTTLENNATNDASTNNVTDYFKINENNFDGSCGLASIKKKRAITIGADDKLIFKVKVFEKTSGTGHFFTVDSYPIDDTTIPLPDDKIRTEHIPSYTANDGTVYDLRDVIDLRPHATNTAVYAAIASNATINPSAVNAFSGVVTPAPNETIEATYQYYIGRNDIVVIDRNGNFELITGTPAENPSYPSEPNKGMLLARISVPPFPTLSTAAANRLNKPNYGVSVSSNQTQRYTMKDIAGIDQRIKNIEYYTSLSLLETSAKDFLVTDSNGNDRFKNGIFVDNFENMYLADVRGGEFSAAIDSTVKDVTPKIRQYPLQLKVKSLTNATNNNSKFITLNFTSQAMPSVSQPFATSVKSCTTSFYNYRGKMAINPAYDSGPETKIAPDVNFSIDLATPFIEFTEALSEVIPLSSVDSEVIKMTELLGMTRTTANVTTRELNIRAGLANTTKVGDFVRNVDFKPFMRAKTIQVSAVGLRPNTRFYFFFDGNAIIGNEGLALVAPGIVDETGTISRKGDWGEPILSDANGKLYAIFYIRAGKFYVGDRKLEIMDVNTLESRDAATSYASVVYSAYNFSSTSSGISSTTRPFRAAFAESSETVTTMTASENDQERDPIAQTFIIDGSLSNDTDVFISEIDLYFARKSRGNSGVTVQIREVINGYPSGNVLPFSSVYLDVDEVNAPTMLSGDPDANSASRVTKVKFEGPIALKVNTEYAVVIIPDGNDPDYLMWICRTGEVDVDSGKYVTQDSNAGVLFTSTNNRAWTPYQNENLKFTLYAANFTSKTGTVELTNADHEFFTIQNVSGTFDDGEEVFPLKTSFATGTISVSKGSNVVTGTGTAFLTDYQVDEYIIIKNGAAYQARKIKSIASNTSLQTGAPFIMDASGMNHYSGPVGRLVYVNTNEPPRMILENSNAKNTVGLKFYVGHTVYGESSGATAEITSIDDLPISYVQPNIYRVNFTKTRTNLQAQALWNGVNETTKDISFNNTNYLTDDQYFIRSKSNSPSTSSFVLNVMMDNVSNSNKPDTSPVIDHDISSVMVAEYIVNGANTTNDIDGSELIGQGNAKAKYVSKVITLADGLDAEDMRVILGAYRPTGTEIRVYARFKSATDTRQMDSVEWTRLVLKPESDTTSSRANRYDYREYEYQLSTDTKTVGQGAWDNAGVINYIANINGSNVMFKNYKFFAIKVVMLANNQNVVPRIKDIRALALS